MDKILTLIVPSFNVEKYLDRCLSSLIVNDKQMTLFEVLVINDGSTDKTSEIARSYESRFPDTFRLIDKENGHYGSCINRGLLEAKGIFIKVLDADDAFDQPVFDTFLSFLSDLRTDDVDLVISGYCEVTEEGYRKKDHPFSDYPSSATVKDISESDQYEWFIHALTYRTSCLRKIHYVQTEKIPYTDMEWAFIPMSDVNHIRKFPGSLYLYTLGLATQSVAQDVHAKNLGIEIQVISNILSFFEKEKDSLKSDTYAFLRNRLLIIIRHIYQLYLLTYKRFVPFFMPLVEFDQLLKATDQDLYEGTEGYVTTIARIPFRPIHNWRSHRYLLNWIQTTLYFIADTLASSRIKTVMKSRTRQS